MLLNGTPRTTCIYKCLFSVFFWGGEAQSCLLCKKCSNYHLPPHLLHHQLHHQSGWSAANQELTHVSTDIKVTSPQREASQEHAGLAPLTSWLADDVLCILLYKQEATRVSWPLLLGTRSYSVVSCAAQTSRCSKKHIACWNRAPEAASWWWSLSAAGGDRRTTRHRRPFPVRWDRRISS